MQISNSIASPATSDTRQGGLFPAGHLLPFFLVTALFFLWGVPNNLNDVLIRQFMKSFAITRFQAGLVQSAFYMGYFVLAMPAALIMRKLGYKAGFVIGLLLFSLGTFLFWPAALAGRYVFFLLALFVIASGLSFLETASNPFIAQLGDPESSERRLNFSQAFNPLGSISGVLIGTAFIFSGVELSSQQVDAMKSQHLYDAYLRSETLRVVKPYLVLGAVALIWAILILRTKFPAIQSEHEAGGDHGRFRDLLRYPHFMLAVVAQFLYVGAQVGTWSYFIQYVQDYTHQPEKVAGYFLTGTLVGLWSRTLHLCLPDAIYRSQQVARRICFVQYRAGRCGGPAAGMGGIVGTLSHQLLHVADVSHHLRAGIEKTWAQHKDRWLAAGNGNRRRGRADTAHGPDCGGPWYRGSVSGSAGNLCICRGLRVCRSQGRTF